jgi:hypothetical protein
LPIGTVNSVQTLKGNIINFTSINAHGVNIPIMLTLLFTSNIKVVPAYGALRSLSANPQYSNPPCPFIKAVPAYGALLSLSARFH